MRSCVQYGESFSLLDWFQQFCAVFNQPQGAEEAAADQGPGKAKKPLVKQRKRGSRKVLVVSLVLQADCSRDRLESDLGLHCKGKVLHCPCVWHAGHPDGWRRARHITIASQTAGSTCLACKGPAAGSGRPC